MINILDGIVFTLLLFMVIVLLIFPLYWIIVDSYSFKVQYTDISGRYRIEYFSVQAASLKRAYKKARRYVNESCMSHEQVEYISLI